MNINLELYKIFYSVALHKNITASARELYISQPAISKSIKKLESELNCTLFIRSKKGVVLTNEGEILFNQIKEVMENIKSVENKIKEFNNLESGYLNIGTTNTITQNYLLPFIKEYHKMYPNIKINIYTGQAANLINKVRAGIIDIIILNLPYQVPSDFKCDNLVSIHDGFFANKNYLFLKDKTISLKELKDYNLILIAKGSNTRHYLDDFCINNKVNLVPDTELTSHSLVKEFTKIGFGIGLITKEYIKEELNNGTLFEVNVSPKLPSRYIGSIYLKEKKLSKAINTFLKLLKEHQL